MLAWSESYDAELHTQTHSARDPAASSRGEKERWPLSLGRYRLGEELGRGAMGVVFAAWDTKARRSVAIKLPLPRPGDTQHERFRREGRTAAALRHASLVEVFDVGELDGTPFIVMARVEGRSLAARCQAEGPLSPSLALQLVLPVIDALQYMHTQGVMHRDVKPGNILVDTRERALLCDLGLSWDVCSGPPLTRSGAFVGTPPYMAPELFSKGARSDARVDVYGAGATLYEALTGVQPHRAKSLEDLRRLVRQPPTPPHVLQPAVGHALSRVTLRALSADPRDRQPTAGALAAELRALSNPHRTTRLLRRAIAD